MKSTKRIISSFGAVAIIFSNFMFNIFILTSTGTMVYGVSGEAIIGEVNEISTMVVQGSSGLKSPTDGQVITISNNMPIELIHGASPVVPYVDRKPKISKKIKEQMLTEKFWLNKLGGSANKVLMTLDQIKEINKNILELPESETKCVDLDKFSKILTRDELLNKLQQVGQNRIVDLDENSDNLTDKEIYGEERYLISDQIGSDYCKDLLKNLNRSAVKDINDVKYGFVAKTTVMRTMPTMDKLYDCPNDLYIDQNSETGLKVWERVLILHESLDSKFYLVQAYNYQGWVKKEDIAVATTKQWEEYKDPIKFIMITGSEVRLEINPIDNRKSSLKFVMGTKLPRPISKIPETIDGVKVQDKTYVVELPLVDKQGKLEVGLGQIPLYNIDYISKDYLPYTQENVLKLAFKMLGKVYGWSNSLDSIDCSSLTQNIYQTFGFKLPRNQTKQSLTPGLKRVDFRETPMNEREKKELIMSSPVGTLLYSPLHVALYIGNYEGEPYIIHSLFGHSSKDGQDFESVASVVVTDLNFPIKKPDPQDPDKKIMTKFWDGIIILNNYSGK